MSLQAQIEDIQEYYNERAGILEYDCGQPTESAEKTARRLTMEYGKTKGYSPVLVEYAIDKD